MCMIALSLFEIGVNKLALFFAVKAIQMSMAFGADYETGKMLLLASKIARRVNRVDDSVVLCKKSLEYLWKARPAHPSKSK